MDSSNRSKRPIIKLSKMVVCIDSESQAIKTYAPKLKSIGFNGEIVTFTTIDDALAYMSRLQDKNNEPTSPDLIFVALNLTKDDIVTICNKLRGSPSAAKDDIEMKFKVILCC